MRHINTGKSIGDYIILSFNIKESHPKLLYYTLPDLYALRGTLYHFIDKVIMVCRHLNLVSQEDVSEIFESFHNA